MRKIVVLMLLLTFLSAGTFSIIGSIVSKERPNVTIKENIVYGDKSHADGITVFTRAHYDRHLYWNTSYAVGEDPITTTEYEFHPSQFLESRKRTPSGLEIDIGFLYGFDETVSADESEGLQKAYRTLYDETTPGTKGTKTIYLQDYYDYYPIRIAMDFPGTMWQGNDYRNLIWDDYKNERAVWDAFNEFFKIPIPKDLPPFEISITKDFDGEAIGIGSDSHDSDYYLNPVSTYTSNQCFFGIGNTYYNSGLETDAYVDTSLIPGGYGIYAFSYKNVRNSTNTQENGTTSSTIFHPGYETGIEAETLQMVYPLQQETQVVHMLVNEEETNLLLFTKEHGITYLTVLDIATMTELQKFEVTDTEQYTFYETENCIVLNGWNDISVIAKLTDGTYQLAFTVPRMKEINDNDYHKGVATSVAFNGEKLAIIDRTADETYGSLELCGFTMAIYDVTGLIYYAKYENSLSAAINPHDYEFNCLPVKYHVSWQE